MNGNQAIRERSIKVKDLIRILKTVPQDYEVFGAIDPEQNSFFTYNEKGHFILGISDLDKVVTLSPWAEGLDYSEIAPLDHKLIMKDYNEKKHN